MTALFVLPAVFFGVLAIRRPPLVTVVGRYVGVDTGTTVRDRRFSVVRSEAAAGGVIGMMLSPGGVVLGGLVGAFAAAGIGRLRRRSAHRARSRRLGQELATVADMCALYVLSGDSVVGALRRLSDDASGVAVAEVGDLLDQVDGGVGFPEAAREAARQSAHRDGARFYELLAQAHRSGARLADSLEMFASDRRAALEREMTVEGGRRALTGYGPILGLMIPTTLLFLMYPTLAGLDALSTTR